MGKKDENVSSLWYGGGDIKRIYQKGHLYVTIHFDMTLPICDENKASSSNIIMSLSCYAFFMTEL